MPPTPRREITQTCSVAQISDLQGQHVSSGAQQFSLIVWTTTKCTKQIRHATCGMPNLHISLRADSVCTVRMSFMDIEFHHGVESRRNGSPFGISGLLVVEVDHVDFLELAPLSSLAVELDDAVGTEVGHFHH